MAELLIERRGRLGAPSPWMSLASDPDVFFVMLVIAAAGVALLVVLPDSTLQDAWLALVDGRIVAHSGIPHHVVLTSLAYGRAWVDQQWLAQLVMYGLHQLGGLGLVGVVNVALIVSALAGAAGASLRLGARPRSVLLVLVLPVIVTVFSDAVRTQPYAYPLFVLTVYLLAADSRRPSRAVYWCLPVLVLWANVHGSAILGAGLIALRGVTLLWERRRRLSASVVAWRRPVGLVAGPAVALLMTPYGIGTISYYRSTLVSSGLRRYVTEWQPVTAIAPLAVPFFLLAGLVLWSMGRHGRETTLWERSAAVILAAGAIIASRNVVWFALATLVVLPVWIDAAVRTAQRSRPVRVRLNLSLLASVVVLAAVLAVRTVASSTAALTPSYPAGALAAVRSVLSSHPGARVYADETYADWLLWELPGLRGRVAYDASFEVLSARQLKATYDFKTITGLNWLGAARGYRILVLNASASSALVRAVRQAGGAKTVYTHGDVSVLERQPG